MSSKQVIVTDRAPSLPAIYSQAIVVNGLVFCSGTIAIDPKDGEIIQGDIKDRTHQVLKNLSAVLEAAKTSLDNVVKLNVYLSNMDDFAAMNEVYVEYFPNKKPCRTCVAVKTLPWGTDVEMECTAVQA
ncbi:hypothetical protein AUEXF2481DRAFT_63115 [Aureobasidium subglaciale EXF-2481]|uniref:Uncharacterized protein n=1 Tax=Aureobasidium subglaciale (strain EXF-2481) TaxID=1043005 RepID=A0A074YU78_AURSE|nr:uncharacterized protein AUEXF2481DRAFT_63115 [Aureobasidium subglaciale EXF-2481]KEQ97657.1 hypothetical protein AUEXF2481DRAFT_63115 [Aureobasidium subglaciale EXF-2481]